MICDFRVQFEIVKSTVLNLFVALQKKISGEYFILFSAILKEKLRKNLFSY